MEWELVATYELRLATASSIAFIVESDPYGFTYRGSLVRHGSHYSVLCVSALLEVVILEGLTGSAEKVNCSVSDFIRVFTRETPKWT